MNEQDQIKAIAKLDGWDKEATPYLDGKQTGWGMPASKPGWNWISQLPDYLHSRDAIVPVIEKQTKEILYRIVDFLCVSSDTYTTAIAVLLAPPELLCEALLRATGKWKE